MPSECSSDGSGFQDELGPEEREFFQRWRELLDLGQHEEAARFLAELEPDTRERLQREQAGIEALLRLFEGKDTLKPGARIGPFEIVKEIDHGATSLVWKARRLADGRFVALKILLPVLRLFDRARERFCAEGELHSRLSHPYIIRFLDRSGDDGPQYIATELIEPSRTLGDELDALCALELNPSQWRAHERFMAKFFARFAEGLAYLHSLGIIHRDVKPSNVLITPDGTPRIIDLGIGKADDDVSGRTLPGAVVGTRRYLSPEAITGGRTGFDGRVDVFSLGLTMFEALTLQPAFDESNDIELYRALLHESPVDPRKLRASTDNRLARIVLKATRPNPVDRYKSMDAMRRDLQAYLDGEKVEAKEVGVLERVNRKTQHWPRKAMGIAALSTLVALVLGIGAWSSSGQKVVGDQTVIPPEPTPERPADHREEYRRRISGARLHVLQENWALAQDELLRTRPGERGWEFEHLDLSSDNSMSRIRSESSPVNAIALGIDGTQMIAGHLGGGRYLWEIGTSPRGLLQSLDESVHPPAYFDPEFGGWIGSDNFGNRELTVVDGTPPGGWQATYRLAAFDSSGDGQGSDDWNSNESSRFGGRVFEVVDETNGMPLHRIESLTEPIRMSPDGSLVAGYSRSRQLVVLDTATGEPRDSFGVDPVRDLVWTPDGSRLALSHFGPVAGSQDTISVIDLATSAELARHTASGVAFDLDRHGEHLAFIIEHNGIALVDVDGHGSDRRLYGHNSPVTQIALAPDGDWASAGTESGEIRVWSGDAPPALIEMGSRGERAQAIAVASSGGRIVYGDDLGRLFLHDGTDGRLLTTLRAHRGGIFALAFGRDDQVIASAGGRGDVRLWSAEDGTFVGVLLEQGPTVKALDVHPTLPAVVIVNRLGQVTFARADPDWMADDGQVSGPIDQWTLSTLEQPARGARFSPDGSRLYMASVTSLVIFDIDDAGSIVPGSQRLARHDAKVAPGADCTVLAVGSVTDAAGIRSDRVAVGFDDGSVHIWGADFGSKPEQIHTPGSTVSALAFDATGERLAVVDATHGAVLFDTRDGDALLRMESVDSRAIRIAFDAKAQRFLTTDDDGMLRTFESTESDARKLWAETLQRRKLAAVIEPLFERHLLVADVLGALEVEFRGRTSQEGISTDNHEAAIRLARAYGEFSPWELNLHAWALAGEPTESLNDIDVALRAARLAVAGLPEKPGFRHTLGVALYRAGEYEEALHALRETDAAERASAFQRSRSQTKAALALVLAALNQFEAAHVELDAATALLSVDGRTGAHSLIMEAEAALAQ